MQKTPQNKEMICKYMNLAAVVSVSGMFVTLHCV